MKIQQFYIVVETLAQIRLVVRSFLSLDISLQCRERETGEEVMVHVLSLY